MSDHTPCSEVFIPMNDRDDAVLDYAIGNLSPAKHALMACAIELDSDLAEMSAVQTSVAATMLDNVEAVPLSPLFIGKVLEQIPANPPLIAANDSPSNEIRLSPKPLRDLMDGAGLRDIVWKSLVPGVAVHDVLGNRRTKNGDRLYLLKAKGGMRMPEHSHNGEEWTLILKGSYSVDGKIYKRGDLHMEDENGTHSPEITEGEDCVCLVMTQGPLVMKGWLPKIVQRVVGI